MNLSTAIDGFIDHLKTELNRSPKTIKLYLLDLQKFVNWLGDINVEAINVNNIGRFRYYLNNNYRIKSTVNRDGRLQNSSIEVAICRIKTFMYYLKERRMITINPEEIKIGKIEYRPRYALTEEELERFLSIPDVTNMFGLRNKAILELFISTGLRLFELAKLDKNDINFETKEFNVLGKGGKRRIVYLNNRAAYWLQRYLSFRADGEPALFINHLYLKRLTEASIKRVVMDTGLEAHLPKNVSSHILRHTFATMLLDKNVNLFNVQALMGHSDIRTTQVYIHHHNPQLKMVHQAALNF